MSGFTVSARIEAPIEKVFASASDLENVAQIMGQIEKIELLTPGPIGVGTRFRETRKLKGHSATETMEITEFETNRRYVVTCDSHGAKFLSEFRFRPIDGNVATTVEVDFRARPVSFVAKMMAPLMKAMEGIIRQCVEQDLSDLKHSLERSTA
jgi:uncharacterized membrane protein